MVALVHVQAAALKVLLKIQQGSGQATGVSCLKLNLKSTCKRTQRG
jgi:hypothetical protein